MVITTCGDDIGKCIGTFSCEPATDLCCSAPSRAVVRLS